MKLLVRKTVIQGDVYINADDLIRILRKIFRIFPCRATAFIWKLFERGEDDE